jgi:hypothetical protein
MASAVPRQRFSRTRAFDLAALALLGLALALLILAALPTRLAFAPGEEPPGVRLGGFFGVERNAGGSFRWTRPMAELTFPLDTPAAYRVVLTLADNPAVQPPRTVRIAINGTAAGSATLTAAPREYAFQHDTSPREWKSTEGRTLRVELATEPWSPPGDARSLGVIVTEARVEPRPALLPWQLTTLALWLLLSAAAWVSLRRAGATPPVAFLITGGLLLLLILSALTARATVAALAYRPITHPLSYLTLLGFALVAPPAWVALRHSPRRHHARAWTRSGLLTRLGRHRITLAIAAVGAVTAFYRLGTKGLWGDEVWEASWSRQQDLPATFARFRAPPDLPLHFILTRLATTFDDGEFWVRLPAALLGTATVVLTFLLGRRVAGTAVGVLAALLLAVAPYHVWYAQEARPYAGLACYSTLSVLCFVSLLRRPLKPVPGAWLGFAIATTLNIYNHLFGLFPLAVEVIAAGCWALVILLRARRATGPRRATYLAACRRAMLALASATMFAAVLTLPVQDGIVAYVRSGGTDPGNTPFRLSSELVAGIFGAFGFGTGWRLWAVATLALVGAVVGLRRQRGFALLAVAWLTLPFLFLVAAQSRHNFIFRYFLFMQPVYLLLAARGLWQVAGLLAAPLRQIRLGSLPLIHWRRLAAAVLIGLALTMAVPTTWHGYRVEKITDWSAICRYLRAEIAPGDRVTGDGYVAGTLSWCFRDGSVATVEQTDGKSLTEIAAVPHTIWYIALGEVGPRRDAAFLDQGFARIPRATWARSDLRSPLDGCALPAHFTFPQSEGPATIFVSRYPRPNQTPGAAVPSTPGSCAGR